MADQKISSQSAAMSLAIQAAKGTAATTGFQTGLLRTSVIPKPAFDVIEQAAEHPSTVLTRTTTKVSPSERTGYLTPIGCGGFLYPRYIGMLLIAVGFKVATVDNTGSYAHTFTIEADASLKWLSALYQLSTELDLLVTDARLNQLTITATPDDIQFSAAGNGLSQGEATGSETKNAEQKVKIIPTLPTSGGWTFEIGGVALTANKVRGFTCEIGQPLEEDDRALWNPTRADMNRDTFGVTGSATDINMDASIFEKTIYGGTGNTAVDLEPVEIEIMALWESATEFDTGVPYSLQIDIPNAELSAEITDANEADTVYFSFNYEMIDDSADPITITLINDVASYASA